MGWSLKFSGPLSRAVDFVSITSMPNPMCCFHSTASGAIEATGRRMATTTSILIRVTVDSLTQEFRLLSSPQARIFNEHTTGCSESMPSELEESDDILSSGLYDDSVDAPLSYCTPCLDSTTPESDYKSKTIPFSAGSTAT